jgi:D-alanyl-lipoteichoic acid acyltransferase DltB (MBOAT superfamily)
MPLNIKFRNIGKLGIILAIIINMVLVGLWHGSKLIFIAFGFFQGLLFVPLILSGAFSKKSRLKTNKFGLPCLKDSVGILATLILQLFGFTIFRAENVGQAWRFIQQFGNVSIPFFSGLPKITLIPMELINRIPFVAAVLLFIIEWFSYKNRLEYALCLVSKFKLFFRYFIYLALFLMCIFFSGGEGREFIYQGF